MRGSAAAMRSLYDDVIDFGGHPNQGWGGAGPPDQRAHGRESTGVPGSRPDWHDGIAFGSALARTSTGRTTIRHARRSAFDDHAPGNVVRRRSV